MDFLLSLASDGAIFALVSLGVLILFVWGKIADLTPDASFTWGAVGAWAGSAHLGVTGGTLLVVGFSLGAAAGLCTYLVARAKIPYLMASLIVVGASYSLTWIVIGGPLGTIELTRSPFSNGALWGNAIISAAILGVTSILVWRLASSQFGLLVRASCESPSAVPNERKWSEVANFSVLTFGNGVVGLAGAMFACQSYFAEINMGTGMLISGLGSFLLGWAIFGFRTTVAAAVMGAVSGAILLRSILTIALANDVPGEWFRALSSAAILVCLLLAKSGIREAFKELRM